MAFDAILVGNEPGIRLGVFVSAFVLIALWELFAPRRVLEIPRRVRWANNLGLAVVNIFFVRVSIPSAADGMAILACAPCASCGRGLRCDHRGTLSPGPGRLVGTDQICRHLRAGPPSAGRPGV